MSSGCAANSQRAAIRRDFLIMNGNGGMISARYVTREAAKTVMSGPASGVMAAAYTGRRAGLRQPRHLRHGRHLDRRGADPRRRAGGLQRDRDRICDADPRADGRRAHGRRRRRLDRAGRRVRPDPGRAGKRRRQSRADLLRPRRHASRRSPTPTCVLGRLDPKRLLAVDAPVTRRACAADLRREDRRADRPRRHRGGRRGAAARQPQDGGRDPHGVGRRAATIRATSRCSPSAAPGRCMPRRWRANSACRRVLVPARPGITNALGCVVADLRHDFVNTVNQPVAALDEAAVRARSSRASAPRARR